MFNTFKEYAKYYDLTYKDKDYKGEAEFVYNWAQKPESILDVGCGTGRHAEEWAKLGCQVTAVDRSLKMLGQINDKYRVEYFNYSVDSLDKLLNKYDCVTAMFNVVGYCGLDLLLRNAPTKQGGYLVFDCWDSGRVARDKPKPTIKMIDEKIARAVLPIVVNNYKLLLRVWILDKHETYEEIDTLFHYDLEDVTEYCEINGYKIVSTKKSNDWTVWYKLQKL